MLMGTAPQTQCRAVGWTILESHLLTDEGTAAAPQTGPHTEPWSLRIHYPPRQKGLWRWDCVYGPWDGEVILDSPGGPNWIPWVSLKWEPFPAGACPREMTTKTGTKAQGAATWLPSWLWIPVLISSPIPCLAFHSDSCLTWSSTPQHWKHVKAIQTLWKTLLEGNSKN